MSMNILPLRYKETKLGLVFTASSVLISVRVKPCGEWLTSKFKNSPIRPSTRATSLANSVACCSVVSFFKLVSSMLRFPLFLLPSQLCCLVLVAPCFGCAELGFTQCHLSSALSIE